MNPSPPSTSSTQYQTGLEVVNASLHAENDRLKAELHRLAQENEELRRDKAYFRDLHDEVRREMRELRQGYERERTARMGLGSAAAEDVSGSFVSDRALVATSEIRPNAGDASVKLLQGPGASKGPPLSAKMPEDRCDTTLRAADRAPSEVDLLYPPFPGADKAHQESTPPPTPRLHSPAIPYLSEKALGKRKALDTVDAAPGTKQKRLKTTEPIGTTIHIPPDYHVSNPSSTPFRVQFLKTAFQGPRVTVTTQWWVSYASHNPSPNVNGCGTGGWGTLVGSSTTARPRAPTASPGEATGNETELGGRRIACLSPATPGDECLPTAPGGSGCSARGELLGHLAFDDPTTATVGGGGRGAARRAVWSVFSKIGQGKKYVYLGEYEFYKEDVALGGGGSLTFADEQASRFGSFFGVVVVARARLVLRLPAHHPVRARLALAQAGRLELSDLGAGQSPEEAALVKEEVRNAVQGSALPLDEAHVVEALRSGKETLSYLSMRCVGYDRVFVEEAERRLQSDGNGGTKGGGLDGGVVTGDNAGATVPRTSGPSGSTPTVPKPRAKPESPKPPVHEEPPHLRKARKSHRDRREHVRWEEHERDRGWPEEKTKAKLKSKLAKS